MKIQKSFQNEANKLYIVPTPIGNLEDITYRSINTLKTVDIIYCEDTRVTRKLLSYYEIEKPTASYNEFNKEKVSSKIIDNIKMGQNVAVVSDAGMPGISDPGYEIINKCIENEIDVVVLPGPSAFVVGLVRSNFFNNRFSFHGFLSPNKNKKLEELKAIIYGKYPTVIYESPHKLVKTLESIQTFDNEVQVCVGREITKIYEEYVTGSVQEVANHYIQAGVKGECLIVIEPIIENLAEIDSFILYQKFISQGIIKKEAVKKVAKEKNVSKNEIYQLVIEKEANE